MGAPYSLPDRANQSSGERQARQLLRRMLAAENHLKFAGDETTILYRSDNHNFATTETVERNGPDNYRLVFHSPTFMAGMIVVTHGNKSWH